MMITLAGAMSTTEMGKILADMIREDKVDIISCTGAEFRRRFNEFGSAFSLQKECLITEILHTSRRVGFARKRFK